MLKREDRIKGYGLELPNIQKDADKAEAEIIAKRDDRGALIKLITLNKWKAL